MVFGPVVPGKGIGPFKFSPLATNTTVLQATLSRTGVNQRTISYGPVVHGLTQQCVNFTKPHLETAV